MNNIGKMIVSIPLVIITVLFSCFFTEIQGQAAAIVETPAVDDFDLLVQIGTSIEIGCATEGAAIYYTIDGDNPD